MNSVEWAQAQGLLLELIKALAPLAKQPISMPLRFFIPPTDADPRALQMRHLTTLYSVQEQVEEWIGDIAAPLVEKENTTKPGQPLSKQAQKLIHQVQAAIGKLCSSTNIKNPEEAPLRETLQTLKPSLDQIIETVMQEGTPSAFRFPAPHFPREPLIKKQIVEPSLLRAPQVQRETPLQPKEALGPSEPFSHQSSAVAVQPEYPSNSFSNQPSAPRALHAAPFVPDSRTLSPARKKKKRKGLWFRDDDEEDRR